METTIQHIELINQYLNNSLSVEAKSSFIKKLETDLAFNSLYQEHIVLVEGINRAALREEIANAKHSYTTTKWLKISGISIIVISTMVLLYSLLNPSKSEIEQLQPNQNNTLIQLEETNQTIINDSDKPIVLTEITLDESTVDDTSKFKEDNSLTGLESCKKKSQIITLNTNKDTIIKLKEGTILKIKANSFVRSGDKLPVKGNIDFEVTEYYNLSDMLLANLTTTSNGEQLETGGMLYIEAFNGDELLELKQNSKIEISFPSKKKKDGMKTFLGTIENDKMNWVLDLETDTKPVSEPERIEVPFSVIEKAPVFPGCKNLSQEENAICFKNSIDEHIQKNFNMNIPLQLGLTGRQQIRSMFKVMETGEIQYIQSSLNRPELINEANRVLALLPKMKPGTQRGRAVIVPYSLPIIFEIQGGNADQTNSIRFSNRDSSFVMIGNQIKIHPIIFDTIYSPTRGTVEMIREVMHDANFDVNPSFLEQWNLYRKDNLIREFNKSSTDRKFLIRKQVFEAKDSRYKILEDDSITRGGHVIRIPWDKTKVPTTSNSFQLVPRETFYAGTEALTGEEFENRVNDVKNNTSVSTSDVSNYILKTSKLGWINCDRFINGRTKRIKYKLKIKNSENTIVNMVFKSVNSVLPSWNSNEEFDFGTVSDASEVVLVAIKKEEGKLFLDIVDTKTSTNANVNFEFKEVTLQEMKSEFIKLNSLFD